MREPGANPGRSRRCKGRRSPATKPLTQVGKAAREGAPSQKTCRAPHNRTPRGREDSGASFLSSRRRCGGGGLRRVRVRRRQRQLDLATVCCKRCRAGSGSAHVRDSQQQAEFATDCCKRDRLGWVPGDDRRLQRERHGLEEAAPHRLAVADGDRVVVRDRRRIAGGRGRRPVRLPEERSADRALRLHSERRGDCRLPTRPRGHRLRPEGPLWGTRSAWDHGHPPRRRGDLQGRVSADPAARARHRSRSRGDAGNRQHEVEASPAS